MRLIPTSIEGVRIVELDRLEDERGFFARRFCEREMHEAGLDWHVVQVNVSYNAHAGTLRGMHWQAAPHEESKIVRCTRGAVHDVAVDLREGSATFGRHVGLRLDVENRTALHVPQGCAHGFLTLEDDTEVDYLMSAPHDAGAGRGVRHDDPVLAIRWPVPVRTLSRKDALWPLLGR